MNWSDKEIKDLRKFAHKTFGVEIPLSVEIEKIALFMSQHAQQSIEDNSIRINKVYKYVLSWIPCHWNRLMEMDIPTSIMDLVYEKIPVLLQERCDELAKLCGYPIKS